MGIEKNYGIIFILTSILLVFLFTGCGGQDSTGTVIPDNTDQGKGTIGVTIAWPAPKGLDGSVIQDTVQAIDVHVTSLIGDYDRTERFYRPTAEETFNANFDDVPGGQVAVEVTSYKPEPLGREEIRIPFSSSSFSFSFPSSSSSPGFSDGYPGVGTVMAHRIAYATAVANQYVQVSVTLGISILWDGVPSSGDFKTEPVDMDDLEWGDEIVFCSNDPYAPGNQHVVEIYTPELFPNTREEESLEGQQSIPPILIDSLSPLHFGEQGTFDSNPLNLPQALIDYANQFGPPLYLEYHVDGNDMGDLYFNPGSWLPK